jgi:hypothetical protein
MGSLSGEISSQLFPRDLVIFADHLISGGLLCSKLEIFQSRKDPSASIVGRIRNPRDSNNSQESKQTLPLKLYSQQLLCYEYNKQEADRLY